MARDTLRPTSSTAIALSVEDLIVEVIAAHDRGDPHFATIARESMLAIVKRMTPSPPPKPHGPWDDEVTRDVGTRDTKRNRAIKRR